MAPLEFVAAESLACARAGRLIFRDLDFRVEAGELLAIEGPNGSGKTSLLRTVAGLLRVAHGILRFKAASGEVRDAEERGKYVEWLGHQDAIKPQLTSKESLRFYGALYRNDEGRIGLEKALEQVGLGRAADIPCQYLSAGQRRRLALARLTHSHRPVWLLDEPLAALDAQGKDLLRQMIGRHCGAGGIAIAATHEPLGVTCIKLALA